MEECTNSYGRKIKVPAHLTDFLLTSLKGPTTQKRTKLVNTLADIRSTTEVSDATPRDVQDRFKDAVDSHDKLLAEQDDEIATLSEEEKKSYFEFYNEETETIATENAAICMFLATTDPNDPPKEPPRKKTDTQSVKTHRTSASSRRNKALIQEATLRATAEAELALLKQKVALDAQRQKLAAQAKELETKDALFKLESELSVAKAKIKAYEDLETDVSDTSLNQSQNLSADDMQLNAPLSPIPKVKPDEQAPPKHESTRTKDQSACDSLEVTIQKVFSKVADALDRSSRNTAMVEPQVFKGDPLEYLRWRKMFEELVEKDVRPERRLVYLLKYTAGPAKDCVENVPFLETESAYLEALRELDERFGDEEEIHEAYKSKLRSWPFIKEGDGPGLRKFSDFLTGVQITMAQLPSLNILNEPSENRSILRKLPRKLVDKWSYKVENWGNKQENPSKRRFPPFSEFVRFIKTEARVENGFIRRLCKPKIDLKNLKTSRAFLTDIDEEEWMEDQLRSPSEFQVETVNLTAINPPCPLCKAIHELDQCPLFRDMRLDARAQLLRKEGRCRRCLIRGHMARGCISSITCSTCQRGHHTLLHDDDFRPRPRKTGPPPNPTTTTSSSQRTDKAQTFLTSSNAEDTSLIVPVHLSSAQNPSLETECYAVLDEQSSSSFVSTDLLRNLHLRGTDVTLKLETMAVTEFINTERLSDLMVRGAGLQERIPIKRAYARPTISSSHALIPEPSAVSSFEHLREIAPQLLPVNSSRPIGILLGRNCIRGIKPRQIIPGKDEDPYGVRTLLGWGVVGDLSPGPNPTCHTLAAEVFCTHSTDLCPDRISKILEQDFSENMFGKAPSIDDKKFLTKMEKGMRIGPDGRITLPLPLKDDEPFPDNSREVLGHMRGLKKRLLKDPEYHKRYTIFMNKLLEAGHAEKAPPIATPGRTWRLQHRGVYSEKKPDEVRVCMNGSAVQQGVSLNNKLLQGPDLTNSLQGVLLRFRTEDIALTCDIQAMFYQVLVDEADRDLLRFYWFPDGDLSREPEEYRMTVHMFGATSSPTCANLALQKLAQTHAADYDDNVVEFITNEFYVDDGLLSKDDERDVLSIASQSQELCLRGGFVLHKFASSSPSVLEKFPTGKLAKGLQTIDILKDVLHVELTLGMQWQMLRDCFVFEIQPKIKPVTRRGILSTTSSIFDPLGLISPLVLLGKIILQEVCQLKKGWDEILDESIAKRWQEWLEHLKILKLLEIPRCYKPRGFGKPVTAELHLFSDASISGYGQCSYLRLVNEEGRITTCLVYSKARVTPLKPVTVPRLELTAAVTSAKVACFLRSQFKYPDLQEFFWTDSKVVLGYLNNTSQRYHIYVANRVEKIRKMTDVSRWKHVETDVNPADFASRGLTAGELVNNSLWFQGPPFLQNPDVGIPDEEYPLIEPDPEIKAAVCLNTKVEESWDAAMERKMKRFSSLRRLILAVAVIMRAQRRKKKLQTQLSLSCQDLDLALEELVRIHQSLFFPDIIRGLQRAKPSDRTRPKMHKEIVKLHPYLDSNQLLRVGGRIETADIPFQERHPILSHKRSHLALLLVREAHESTSHGGREITLAAVRRRGFWINAPRSLVDSVSWNCTWCIRFFTKPTQQTMGQLPSDRVNPSAPFQFSAVDVFGPFFVKVGRSMVKRFVAMYVCLASGAVHLEPLASMTTDSFINSLRRIMARRGQIQELRCDQGTNFMGSHDVTLNERHVIDHERIKTALRNWRCEYVLLRPHPPQASNMNGACERQIRTARRIWCGILQKHPGHLSDELFPTLLCEIETIMNWRPLASVTQGDDDFQEVLSPGMLLTSRPTAPTPPPGDFSKVDLYTKQRWRTVQTLAEEFWRRWRAEILPKKIPRRKWHERYPNLVVGDLIILSDAALPRNSWPLARVTSVKTSTDGVVRSIVATNAKGSYERPVNKILRLNVTCSPETPADANGD